MLKNIPSTVNKSSIIPVTLTLETECEVQLMYELLGRIDFKGISDLLKISDEEARNLMVEINVISEELEEFWYNYSDYALQMTEITE